VQKQTNAKRYIFQGDAIGVAGQIIHPFHDTIPVQAASALPAGGGVGSARVDGFRYKEILSFASAYTEVVGTEAHGGVFETLSLSVVEKFNLLDVVTCDRIVARITAKHPGDRKEDSGLPPETSAVPIGSRFEGLRIGNTFFERLELAPDYFCRPEHACWSGLQGALENEQDRKLLAPLSLPGPDGNPAPLPLGGQASGVLGFCVALSEPKPGAELGAPLIFKVPQFGTVHLGEFFCHPYSRHLIMVRADLGCPVQGGVSVCGAVGGGESYP
jgi:hypothetical protein